MRYAEDIYFNSTLKKLVKRRKIFQGTTKSKPATTAVPTWRPKRENCTPPAIEQFPRPLMGPNARRNGGIIIHIFVAVYAFIALAIVCDDYFVSSLDRICEGMLTLLIIFLSFILINRHYALAELKLSPDVAGATFMAAGSSAPELATVVIGVFFAKDDIGVSGVIGSAVFNIMFVISVSKTSLAPSHHECFSLFFKECFHTSLDFRYVLYVLRPFHTSIGGLCAAIAFSTL